MAVTTIEKFVVALGFDFDPDGLEEFQQGVSNVGGIVKTLTKTLAGATAALFGMTTATTAAVDEQGKMAEQIGISVEDLDAYGTAATLAGGSAESMSNSLYQLSIRASEASRGMGSGVEAFGILGISATDANGNLKDTIQLTMEVSKAMQGMDKARQIELADKLGLSGAIRLLQQGPNEIQNLVDGVKDLGVTTDEDAKIAAEFQDSLTNIWKVIKQGSKLITAEFAPIMTDLSDQFLEFWKTNKDIIKQRLPDFIEKISKAMKFLVIITGAFIGAQLVGLMGSLVKSFNGFGAMVGMVNKKLLLIPSLIALVIAGILIAAEDAKTFFEGGDSYFGDWLKKFPEFRNQILIVASAFATVWDIVKMIGSGLGQIIMVISNLSFENIQTTIAMIPQWFGFIISDLMAKFDEFINYLAERFPVIGGTLKTVIDGVKSTLETISAIISSIVNGIKTIIKSLMGLTFEEFKGFIFSIPDLLSNSITKGFKMAFSRVPKLFGSVFKSIGSGITSLFKGGGDQPEMEKVDSFLNEKNSPGAPSFEAMTGGGGDTNNQSNTNQSASTTIGSINISIDGSQEPAMIADELKKQLQQASQDVNSRVFQ